MKESVAIYGAGIAGLTVAHELIDRGFKVTVYEKNSVPGGMARSERVQVGIYPSVPTEHSWRGFAGFYQNLHDITKRIPISKKKTVFDNFSLPLEFQHPKNELNPNKKSLTLRDRMILGYPVAKAIFSDRRRREVYARKGFDNLGKNLSEGGKDATLGMVGPGIGLDIRRSSLHHIARFVEMTLSGEKHSHVHNNREYTHTTSDPWHALNGPTSEAWIGPWTEYLKKKGVKIRYNMELIDISTENDRIVNCMIRDTETGKKYRSRAGIYVICVNPYDLSDIIKKSPQLEKFPQLDRILKITEEPPHNQIAFQILLNKRVRFKSGPQTVIALPDSPYNITLYPQDEFWHSRIRRNPSYLGDTRIKGLWSGTLTIINPKNYPPATELSKKQLQEEIIEQVFGSEELQDLIYRDSKGLRVLGVNIWHEWKWTSKYNVKSTARKWVNSLTTNDHRPEQKTQLTNLYLGGAHTRTSTDIWSMEGAVESGKRVASEITHDPDLYLYTHAANPMLITRAIRSMDNMLFAVGLPHIFDTLVIILVISLIIFVARKFD